MDTKYKPIERLFYRKTKISEFIVDETQIKVVGSEYIWLWIAIEPENKEIVGLRISKEMNMFVAERDFCQISLKNVVENIQFLQMVVVPGIHKHADS